MLCSPLTIWYGFGNSTSLIRRLFEDIESFSKTTHILISKRFVGNRHFDCISENDQEFMFLPRPSRPPFLIGGTAEYAFDRAVAYGDGWIPMAGKNIGKFRAPIKELRDRFFEADKGEPEIAFFTRLAYEENGRISDQIEQMIDVGATTIIHGGVRYRDSIEFFDIASAIAIARSK